MTDIFNLQASSKSQLKNLSEDAFAYVKDFLNREVTLTDRVSVMTGLAQLALEELIRTHPACPCEVIQAMCGWMTQVAAQDRFQHPFVMKAGFSIHNSSEGTEHAPS